jgi:hypothetical protein
VVRGTSIEKLYTERRSRVFFSRDNFSLLFLGVQSLSLSESLSDLSLVVSLVLEEKSRRFCMVFLDGVGRSRRYVMKVSHLLLFYNGKVSQMVELVHSFST